MPRIAISLWRLAILTAACLCLHQAHRLSSEKTHRTLDPAWIAEVQAWLPNSDHFGELQPDDPLTTVLDAEGETIGWATQTFPEAQAITGYSGSSNLLLILDRQRRVIGASLLSSEDTAGHVAKIEKDGSFFSQWSGRPAASFGTLEEPMIVSGATLTSDAIARGLAARFGATDADQWFPDPISIEFVRTIFPEAEGLQEIKPGIYQVTGSQPLLTVLRASRMGVAVRGFQGPSDLLIFLEANRIKAVRFLASRDNQPYTLDVADELKFADPFAGIAASDLIAENPAPSLVVSGASDTARSVTHTVREMLRRHLAPAPAPATDWRTIAGLLWIATGLTIGLTKLRSHRKLRMSFAVVSLLGGGLWLGWMVAQDQWISWAKRGTLSGAPLALLVLSAAAILVPSIFGKNVYCAHLCPHGAAQTLIGTLKRRRFSLPKRLHTILKTIPWLSLIALWILAFTGSSFSASYAEPFEIWSAGFFALLPTLIFAIGLISAAFLPQGYCHYGCPTGALLKFLTHSPSHWTLRDTIAASLIAIAWLVVLLP